MASFPDSAATPTSDSASRVGGVCNHMVVRVGRKLEIATAVIKPEANPAPKIQGVFQDRLMNDFLRLSPSTVTHTPQNTPDYDA